MKQNSLQPYLSAGQVQSIVSGLAKTISKDYSEKVSEENSLTVVVVLRGAFYFAADLTRRLTVPIRLDFVRLASYGNTTQPCTAVKLIKDIETPTRGAHVLIVDDIADTGHTLSFLKERLFLTQPKSVKICTLLNKPSRREVKVALDYFGTEVDNKFFVGYGLDFDERYRNSPGIFSLEMEGHGSTLQTPLGKA